MWYCQSTLGADCVPFINGSCNMYFLMYFDSPVLSFSKEEQNGIFLDREKLPFAIRGEKDAYEAIKTFCASRILMMNREHSKEILASCGIEDKSPLNICITGRGLSLRDNYWIREEHSGETWAQVNLYDNSFSEDVALTALTGESTAVAIGDGQYTGELTNRGTKTKCLFRKDGSVFLAKAETDREIAAEVLSGQLNKILGIPAATYTKSELFQKRCSVCRIATSPQREMIPCRDILQYYGGRMDFDSAYYKAFMEANPKNFIKMQIFDYLTLNTDRNRDNFALEKVDGRIKGLYPLFDHDSCFKGLSEKAVYFVTGRPFDKTISSIKERYPEQYEKAILDLIPGFRRLEVEGKTLFDSTGLSSDFDGVMARIEKCR